MKKMTFFIMHGEKKVAMISTNGQCEIYERAFLPYHLYLDDSENDIDTLVNNVTNFYYWCATRVLTLDRQYAKEILNSIGASQASTDKERAMIALSYHCLSLTDVYWVKKEEEDVTYKQINLYENRLSNAFVDISLRGRQMTVENHELAKDLSTSGCFPKAWIRTEDGFRLLKDGGESFVQHEILASKICQCFRCNQVIYEETDFEGTKVTACSLMTNQKYSIVSREAFEIYAQNHELDAMNEILELDAYSYYMMNILDYLIGNTDRHWGNWGLLIDNETNLPVSLHPLMDLNQSFRAYDTLEGANCQSVRPIRMTQKEAAAAAVAQVGLNQIKEVKKEWFGDESDLYQMFVQRFELLKKL